MKNRLGEIPALPSLQEEKRVPLKIKILDLLNFEIRFRSGHSILRARTPTFHNSSVFFGGW